MLSKNREIVVITPSFGNGGVQRVTLELIKDWDKKGYKVSIIQTHTSRSRGDYDPPNNVTVIKPKASNAVLLKYLNEIWLIRKQMKLKPDAVFVALSTSPQIVLSLAAVGLSNEWIVSERSDPRVGKKGIKKLIKFYAFKKSTKCVFQTEDAMKLYPFDIQQKGTIIQNPIMSELPLPYEGTRRKTIVTACRLSPEKNLPMLFSAFKMLQVEHPDYDLEVYGRARGAEKEEMDSLIVNMGLQGKIKLMGFAKDVHERIKDCAVFALASNYEGMSNSMLEAMAMGMPCVITDHPVGGARAVIQNGKNGILVPVGDVNAMYQGLKLLVEDPILANQLGKEASKIRLILTTKTIGDQWLSFM